MHKKKEQFTKASKSQRNQVFKFIKIYKEKFGLKDYKYTIKFVRGEKVKKYYAEVVMRGKNIKLYMNEDWMEKEPFEINNTVIHELLHIVLYKFTEKTTSLISQYVRRTTARQKLKKRFLDLEHDIIDKLTPAFNINQNKKYHSKEKHREEL